MSKANNPFKKMWRMYTSITFGLIILSIIAGVCIYGTMFYAANKSLGDNAIPLAKARVFNAWWFFALLAFFFVQFVTSTWRVTIMSFGIWWKKDFSRTSDQLALSASHQRISVESPDSIPKLLGKKFTRVHMENGRVFAHKGIASRLGPTIIHSGIVLILLAGLVRIILSKEGYIISEGRFSGVEGETYTEFYVPKDLGRVISQDNIEPLRIKDYDIKVHDFDEIKFANSTTPAYFSSLVEVINRKDNTSRFMKLDMNHSMNVGGLQFHQASFVMIPPIEGQRMNYDVRFAESGERLAVADASPGTRVQIAQTEYFLEVDGEAPGDAWRIFSRENPGKPLESGKLLASSETLGIRLKPVEFFPDFHLEEASGAETPKAISKSNVPKNPALMLEMFQGEMNMGKTMIFMDKELNKLMPPSNPFFRFEFEDIQTLSGSATTEEDFAKFDWTDPSMARFIVNVVDLNSGLTTPLPLVLNEESEGIKPSVEPQKQLAEAGGKFMVYPLERTMKYATIFSVVREPLTHYNTIGVGLIFIGAMMTFIFRYRALHGIWHADKKEFEFAVIPRFGKPDMEEVQQIVKLLSPNSPTSTTTNPSANPVTT